MWKSNFDRQVGGSVCLRMIDQALQVLRFTWQDPGITKENPSYCNLKQHTGVSDRKFTHWAKKWVKATFIANISFHQRLTLDICKVRLADHIQHENWISLIQGKNNTHGTVELHLSGLIGTASHPETQNIRIIGFFF